MPVTEQEIREQFFLTGDADQAIAGRTLRVDDLVLQAWEQMAPAVKGPVALLAVGGYGRRELFPCSDIDLLILTPDQSSQVALKEPLAFFLRDLWDRNLRISQSVHDPLDCNQIDSSNAELAVSLLDRRLLAGDESLFRQIRDPRPDLGRNIVELTRARHAQFHNTIYHLEPNVKDAPGGLRDLQVLRWLSKLGAGDQEDLGGGVPVLFEIRCFLHYLAARDDNKFSFDRQDEIAELIHAASPEDLMRRYYRAVRGIARLANRRLERFEAKRSSLFSQFRDRTARLSNSDFSVLHGTIFFRSTLALESDPGIILRLCDFVGRHGLPLATDTSDRVERNAGVFREWVERNQPVWETLREILRQPHAARAVRAMHESHVLEAIFPELLEIDALVIRDFYHRYTVDEHTLVAIETVLGLRDGKGDGFADLALETSDLDLLIVALMFHDVGKAAPGESHTVVSRRIAESALKRTGIGERELDVVLFLIGAHLELSAAMNGRDLSDQATIRDVGAATATVERLKLLTLLTFGDISAVNPSAMTPWRRQLLWNLYTETYAELTRELTARTTLPDVHGNAARRHFLTGLPPRYLRTRTSAEIDEHLKLEHEARGQGVAVSLVKSTAWVLTVVGDDRRFLFASIAATLSSFGFNILKAEAFSNAHGTVIDTFTFADPARNLDLNPDDARQVTRTVTRVLNGEITVDHLMTRRPQVKPDMRALAAARAVFNNEASPAATLIELVTQDRPGLLYDVAARISERGANIEVVLVDTEAKKAIDVFYVTRGGMKLSDDDARELTAALSEVARGV
ncbi:MAG TPA: HD domain-containing protein [Bryobacteraceae bacterium]|nr:HD domain-containing protein [Bryobacteraceae bacterium]